MLRLLLLVLYLAASYATGQAKSGGGRDPDGLNAQGDLHGNLDPNGLTVQSQGDLTGNLDPNG